ncbi:hypothetical protein B0T19DRAFT_118851 [Cercophora scortea]|uniref:Uncharacterized protein n=1 Tax=Cercophora scortea TaxID=314031 RepID=A0AAE0MI84_9PEZI|nr:hypothetical protein B0T19DRAFT_118851 [Cercophora scortea]
MFSFFFLVCLEIRYITYYRSSFLVFSALGAAWLFVCMYCMYLYYLIQGLCGGGLFLSFVLRGCMIFPSLEGCLPVPGSYQVPGTYVVGNFARVVHGEEM